MSPRQRRRRGTGGVHQRHDDPDCPPLVDGVRPAHICQGRWAGTYDLPRVDGKRRRRTVYGQTRAEAERKLADAKQAASAPCVACGSTDCSHLIRVLADTRS